MTSAAALIRANVALLLQADALLERIDLATYAESSAALGLAGVGGHLRHVLDAYAGLFAALEHGELDYERRARDPEIERDVAAGRRGIAAAVAALRPLAAAPLERPLAVATDCCETSDPCGSARSAPSSLGRELQFLHSHTVHHFALIAVRARSGGLAVEREFGVAPSTLRHWRELEERARCAR